MTLGKLLEIVQSLIALHGAEAKVYGLISFVSGIMKVEFSANDRS